MAAVSFDIRNRRPYFDGQEFGATGAYERIDGVLQFSVDPNHPANETIVDLTRAQRDAEGRVRFWSDFCILQPLDLGRSNRRVLLELPNRGRKVTPRQFNRAEAEVPPTERILPGDGFLYRHGFIHAFIGWQWDVVRSDALMGLEPPIAVEQGRPIRGGTIVRFQPVLPHRTHLLADRVHKPYPTADIDDPQARLTVRDFDGAPPRDIPRETWRFAREVEEGGDVVPSDSHIFCAAGFEPGLIYELYYETAHSPVVGAGLLAVRDAATFLRYGAREDNPAAGYVEHVYGWGVSQTGRMLRHFLYLGLNLDEEGRMALSGVNPHVGGGRRGEFNHRYGQPSVQSTPGMGFLPPFDDASLLERQRRLGGVPKVIQTNSSAEYYRGDAAMMHISTDGVRDLEPDPDVRDYLFASTQHGPGVVPLTRYNPNDGGYGRYDFNTVDYTPLLRAALVNLDRWVSEGIEPPPSQHPRLADGTVTTREQVFEAFSCIPGTFKPDAAKCFALWRIDAGERASEGIPRFPMVLGDPYPDLVSTLDDDFNEVAGIRLPDLTVPIGTHAGWNPRDPETGAPEQIMSMQGSTLFFPRTRAERTASGDPRRSIEERYASRDEFLTRVRAAAQQLAREGYLLVEDIDIVVSDNAARWDEAMRGQR
jgi:hypothetical protein